MEACVMVIEDDQDIRELLCELLTDEGYAVGVYATPSAAVADLQRLKPDLIILDWLFDRKASGLSMLQRLQLQPTTTTLPVIICSAAVKQIQELEPVLSRRGVQIVFKPFAIDELLKAVRGSLQNSTMHLQPVAA
jgi:DNA-binding response OmpR family regulator